MGYVIMRDDGEYVARSGSDRSYTDKLENARRFPTKKAAEKESCPENEQVFAVESLLRRVE